MLALLISLWTISILLMVADSRTESTRWLAAISFFSGLGGLAVLIKENIIPYFQTNVTQDISVIDNLTLLYGISSSLSHNIAPYTLLIYGICYSDIIKTYWNKYKRMIKLLFLLPPILMYIFFPIKPFATSYPLLSIWVMPYVLSANILLVYSFIIEKDMKTRQQRLLTCIIITPGTLMSLMTNYLLRAFDINNAFYYNIAIIILQFAAFIYFSINKGALGIKVTLERNSMDRTMRALTSGTAILNHTIKNQVLKISICMNNIEHAISRINTDKERDVQDNINIVIDATNYLVDMINKIQDHVKDIKIEESELVLGNVIEKAVNMISLFANEKNIIVSRIFSGDYLLKGDVLHLQESFINILKNSIESINSGGLIELDIIKKKKWLSVIIRDNGAGIPKENIPHVIDPFFSTKKRTGNFGLGLSYCYSVMQHHNGSLDIESKEGIGTTVTLNFPTKRLIG